jgi:hypothetical protein
MRTQEPAMTDDPVLCRARRILADVARLVESQEAGVVSTGAARRRILAAAADLDLLIRVLTKSRDALGLELVTRHRQATAISAYGQCSAVGRRYARDSRRTTPTE